MATMKEIKKGKRALKLRPVPPDGIPQWLKERLDNINWPDGGTPDLHVLVASLRGNKQFARWMLSGYEPQERFKLAAFSRFSYNWQIWAATFYARRLAGVRLGDSKPRAKSKLLKGQPKGDSLSVRLGGDLLPDDKRQRCTVKSIMKRVIGLFFNDNPPPGWAYELLLADMKTVRGWKHRNPGMFGLLVSGKLPRGFLNSQRRTPEEVFVAKVARAELAQSVLDEAAAAAQAVAQADAEVERVGKILKAMMQKGRPATHIL